jgi:glycosyltransferase involved in cell wall biosynthesis
MLAVQAPRQGQPVITAADSQQLVSALLARDDGHEYFLYAHASLPVDRIPESTHALRRELGPDELTVSQRIDRLVRLNPEGLDVLVVLSPFEKWSNYHPPAPRVGGGPALAALISDLTPFRNARENEYDPVLTRHYRVLEDLKRYDALLTTTEMTRQECLRLLKTDPGRVATIGGASDDWPDAAARLATLLARLTRRRPRTAARRPARPRPRIAFFSPLPPRKSGVSDYSALLLQELKNTYEIDLYHDSGYVPEPALTRAGAEFGCCDARLFPRLAAVRDYHAVIYQMGNSRYHRFLYDTMLRYPGIVTLHDFCLAGFHLEHGHRLGRGLDYFRQELLRWYPDQASAIAQVVGTSWESWEELGRICAGRAWYLNRPVLVTAEHVVVHSPWCLEQVRATAPEEAGRVEVIPLGTRPRAVPTAAERGAIRERFRLPPEALIVASFGFINRDKMGLEALEAFEPVARSDRSALFVFAGLESDGGAARERAAALGLSNRVRFLGRQNAADYAALIAGCDVGMNLRRPPTNGETSAALLDLLAAGIPTIVTDVATFADYPDHVVRKVRWDARGPAALALALAELASDRRARTRLGNAARDHVGVHHAWSRVANRYIAAIERCHARRTARLRERTVA